MSQSTVTAGFVELAAGSIVQVLGSKFTTSGIAVEIVSDLLMSSDHLRTLSINRTVDDHNGTSNRV
jgi:hypothetical protein